MRCYLVNARHLKRVPGRKSDGHAAQWLQKLHTLGLLQGSFRPDAQGRTLRPLVRYRAALIERPAPHSKHMIQARKPMQIQLKLVLSDIPGTTGLAILRASWPANAPRCGSPRSASLAASTLTPRSLRR
jgi:hypothetical protein